MAGTLGEAAVEIIAETGDFDDDLRRRLQAAIDDAVREMGDDLSRIGRQAEETGRRLADAIGDGAEEASQRVGRLAQVAAQADAAFNALDPEELRRAADEADRARQEMLDLARAAFAAEGAFSSMDPDELARIWQEAERAGRDMERLGRQARQAAAEIERVGDADEVRRLAEQLQRAQREADRLGRTRFQQVQHEARQAGRAIWFAFRGASEDARRALERVDNTRFREVVRRAVEAGERIRRAFDRVDMDRMGDGVGRVGRTLLRLAGAAAAVGALGAALSSLVATAATVVGVLAPTAEILAALPAAALLAGAAIGTLRLALMGVGDAFTAALTGDAAEFEKALKNLSPAAQAVAKEVRALKPEFDRLRTSVQDGFFKQLEGDLAGVARNLGGPLRKGMTDAATEFGRLAEAVLLFGHSSEAVRLVDGVFGTLRTTLGSIRSDTIERLLGAFSRFVRATLPGFDGLGSAIDGALGRLTGFLDRAARSGDALRWVREGTAAVRQLGALFADLGRIVAGVVRAIQSASGSALGSIAGLADRLAAFVNSGRGQAQLVEVFRAVNAIAAQTGPVIEALIGGLATLAPTIAALARQIGPTLTAAIEGIVPGLQGLGAGLVDILEGVRVAVERLGSSGAVGQLGRAFGELLSAVAPLLPAIGDVLASAFQSLAIAAQAVAPVLAAVASALAAVASSPLGAALGPLIAQLILVRAVTGSWGVALKSLLPVLKFAGKGAAGLGRTLFSAVARHPIGAVIAGIVVALGFLASRSDAVRAKFNELREGATRLWERLRTFGSGLVETFRTDGPLAALRQLGSGIVSVAQQAIPAAGRAIAAGVRAIASGLGRLAVAVPGAVADLAPRLISAVTRAFTALVAALPGLIARFISALRAGFTRLSEIGLQLGQGLREAVSAVAASLRTEGPKIAAALKSLLRTAFQFATQDGPALAGQLASGIRSAMVAALTAAASGIRGAGDAIAANLPGLAERIATFLSNAIRKAGEVIPQVLNELAARIGGGVDQAAGQAAGTARSGPGGQRLRQSLVDLLLDVATAFLAQIPRLTPVIGQAIATIGTAVASAALAAAPGIIAALSRLVLTLAQTILTSLLGFLTSLPVRIGAALLPLVTGMVQWGWQAMMGLLRGLLSASVTVIAFVASLPIRFVAALASLGARLASVAISAMGRMASAVSSGASRVVSFLAGLPGRAASAVASLAGRLTSIATSAMSRMASAVSSGIGRVVGLLRSLPGRAVAALSGIAAQMASIGRSMVQGMINGVRGMAGALISTLTGLAKSALNAAKAALGIDSPSKEFAKIGRFVGEGFIQGLTGERDKIRQTILDLVKMIRKAFEGKRTNLDDALIARLKGANKRLQQLARERDRIAELIKTANERAQEVTRQARDFASLSGVVSSLGTDTPKTAQSLAAGLKDRLARLKEFQRDVAELARRGLSKDLLDQIIREGPEAGGALADALLAGPNSVIRDLNRTNEEILKTSKSLGRQSADLLYDSGRKAGAGFLAGLKAQEEQIRKLMERIARQVADAVKRTLKIKSPSRVMAGLGEDTIAGYLAGLEQLAPQIGRSLEQALALPAVNVPAPSLGQLTQPARRTLEALAPAAASRAPSSSAAQADGRGPRVIRQVEVNAPVTVNVPTGDPEAAGRIISARIAAAATR